MVSWPDSAPKNVSWGTFHTKNDKIFAGTSNRHKKVAAVFIIMKDNRLGPEEETRSHSDDLK